MIQFALFAFVSAVFFFMPGEPTWHGAVLMFFAITGSQAIGDRADQLLRLWAARADREAAQSAARVAPPDTIAQRETEKEQK